MAQPQPEKRSMRRFPLDLPISVKFVDQDKREAAASGHFNTAQLTFLETHIQSGLANHMIFEDNPRSNTIARVFLIRGDRR